MTSEKKADEMTLTDSERDTLKETKVNKRERWVYSDNNRPMIDNLVERGLMQPASGEFTMHDGAGQVANVLGMELPIMGTMISLYMLTPAGRAAYSTESSHV